MAWYDTPYARGCLKTLSDGRQAFYPHLVGRRGYVVSDEQRAVLSRFIFAATIFGATLGAVVGSLGLRPIILALSLFAAVYAAVYYGGLRWLTRNLECAPADERPPLLQRFRAQAQHSAWLHLWFFEILGVVFFLDGLSMAGTGWVGRPTWLSLSMAAFGGLLAWIAGFMLWDKWAKNTSPV